MNSKVLGPAGSLTDAAEKALGHKVVIKRFMVTVWGKTGYLHPEQEHAPLTGNSKKLWSSIINCYLPSQAWSTYDCMQSALQS